MQDNLIDFCTMVISRAELVSPPVLLQVHPLQVVPGQDMTKYMGQLNHYLN